jgi:sRNA-binding carbon storage regulator CsrA
MLVLSRKNGEGVRLSLPSGDHIEIYIEQARPGLTLTMTKAPMTVSVERIDSNGNSQVKKNARHK